VRNEYEPTLDPAKSRIGSLLTGTVRIPVRAEPAGDWRDEPAHKSCLAGGYCLRSPAQGACPHANVG
jgi:hypothetical protein